MIDLETFLFTKLGYKLSQLRPKVIEGLKRMEHGRFTVQGEGGAGKSFLANLVIARFIASYYSLSSGRYGMSGNVTPAVLVTGMTGFLRDRQYVIEEMLSNFGALNSSIGEIVFGNLLVVFREPTPEAILGLNVVAALCEETPREVSDSVWRRMQSRTSLDCPKGLLVEVSNPKGEIISL